MCARPSRPAVGDLSARERASSNDRGRPREPHGSIHPARSRRRAGTPTRSDAARRSSPISRAADSSARDSPRCSSGPWSMYPRQSQVPWVRRGATVTARGLSTTQRSHSRARCDPPTARSARRGRARSGAGSPPLAAASGSSPLEDPPRVACDLGTHDRMRRSVLGVELVQEPDQLESREHTEQCYRVKPSHPANVHPVAGSGLPQRGTLRPRRRRRRRWRWRWRRRTLLTGAWRGAGAGPCRGAGRGPMLATARGRDLRCPASPTVGVGARN